ncbi:MAG: SHOCT domain-containing protein [Chloroflexi bacterium]|nr:SHOCT domain-containing protein [Chloroflexota bacterium]
MMGFGMMGGLGFGMPIMGGLFMLGLPILFIAGLIWLVSTITRGNGAQLQTGTTQLAPQAPLDILKARYARGEINKQQFDEMRRHLAE